MCLGDRLVHVGALRNCGWGTSTPAVYYHRLYFSLTYLNLLLGIPCGVLLKRWTKMGGSLRLSANPICRWARSQRCLEGAVPSSCGQAAALSHQLLTKFILESCHLPISAMETHYGKSWAPGVWGRGWVELPRWQCVIAWFLAPLLSSCSNGMEGATGPHGYPCGQPQAFLGNSQCDEDTTQRSVSKYRCVIRSDGGSGVFAELIVKGECHHPVVGLMGILWPQACILGRAKTAVFLCGSFTHSIEWSSFKFSPSTHFKKIKLLQNHAIFLSSKVES